MDAVAWQGGAAMSSGIKEVADSIAVAPVDVGAGLLSVFPSWLVSCGHAAQFCEFSLAVFTIFGLLRAGGSTAGVVFKSKQSLLMPK